jgi:fumarate hydratase class II
MKYVEASKRVFLNTGLRFPRKIIWSGALIKGSSAHANVSLGLLDEKMGEAIAKAADEVLSGSRDGQIVVDVFQTGSGTGLNMNLNEVIAERASELLGVKVHPNDHVNMGQSSNDVVPTAVRIAAVSSVEEELKPALRKTVRALQRISVKTLTVYKSGRTHLRDALPVTMGQEFDAFSDAFANDIKLVDGVLPYVRQVPLGGTAVGTGINTHQRFSELVLADINKRSDANLVRAKSTFRAMRLISDLVGLSSVMRIAALDLYRLCQDIRLMFSGPLTGLGEIDIPTQAEIAGSSIMPGKTNPVTVEAALQASAEVVGLDQANQLAAMLGEFELSMGLPLIGYNVAIQVLLLSEALTKVSHLVLDEIVPQTKTLRRYAESSPALATLLSPRIGYDKSAKLGRRLARGLSMREALGELGYNENQINKLLDMKKLVKPGIPAAETTSGKKGK